jgi:LmbE family N-acetylglucosaminyl deacetylase
VYLAAVSVLVGPLGNIRAAESLGASSILQALHGFRDLGSALLIAAHPDDENTQLITYLSRGRNYRTAYLSVTRGDGGQNLLGAEFGEELGVIRTQELLAARRLDGGRQFFTRAIDFGYSKSPDETLKFWDRQQALSDVVRVIRTFRPDVVITRFSTQGGRGQHGHHTASAILGVEAFKLAGDPKAFPEQLGTLKPWQPRHLFMNGGGFGRGGGADTGNTLRIDVSGNDPASGESFAALAGRSRSQHKTQGFGNFTGGGRGGGTESFQLLAGEPATKDIMDGVDTTWSRVRGGAEIGPLADDVIAKFNPQDASASIPALLAIHGRVAALDGDPLVDEKRHLLDKIIRDCLGLTVETTVPQAEVVPGESLAMHHAAQVRSGIVPVRWKAVSYWGAAGQLSEVIELRPNQVATRNATKPVAASTPITQPYWLRQEPSAGMYRVEDPTLIGLPENPPAFPIQQIFDVGDQTIVIPDEPVQVASDPTKGETRRRVDVIPPVALRFEFGVRLFTPGSARPVEVEVVAFRAGATGIVHLDVPDGWKVTPAANRFRLAKVGDRAKVSFDVTPPAKAAAASLTAQVQVGDAHFDNQHIEIKYGHIPLQVLQPPATIKAVSLDLKTRGHQVGYLPGAGDSVAGCLEQMGYQVKMLATTDLTAAGLAGLDAIVVGVRAFDTHRDLASLMPALFAYVEAGGTVVMQYNRVDGFGSSPLTLRVSQERVTDETAPVTFLAPDHPVLNTPNRITDADFAGWVQERGIYFPNQWDERFTPILASGDPGETPLKGGLLVAQYGRGHFVYTGLVFFRQLPAGVPGAYRLFANLVSLGK